MDHVFLNGPSLPPWYLTILYNSCNIMQHCEASPTSARSFQGTHLFPFTFLLPGSLPSSYESKIGHVRYFIKVKKSRLPPTYRFKICLLKIRNIKEIWIFFRQSLQADIVRDWRWNHKVNYIITKAAYSTKCHKYTKYSTNMPVKKTYQ